MGNIEKPMTIIRRRSDGSRVRKNSDGTIEEIKPKNGESNGGGIEENGVEKSTKDTPEDLKKIEEKMRAEIKSWKANRND